MNVRIMLAEAKTADKVIAEIDVMVDQLNFNNFSLNIYPDNFDADGDGRIDPARQEAYAYIGRILDHCWKCGGFYALSFQAYNIGGGGTPASFFAQHPEAVAINALGEKARDHEYTVSDGNLIPSVYHPAYHAWSRTFIRNFLGGLGADRCSRLLFVETTVEPQYPGACRVGDKDPRRAFLDFNEAAHRAFDRWQERFSESDPHRTQLVWPTNGEQRDRLLGNRLFNDFRACGLAQWVSESPPKRSGRLPLTCISPSRLQRAFRRQARSARRHAGSVPERIEGDRHNADRAAPAGLDRAVLGRRDRGEPEGGQTLGHQRAYVGHRFLGPR